jgi:hypothetical protein
LKGPSKMGWSHGPGDIFPRAARYRPRSLER